MKTIEQISFDSARNLKPSSDLPTRRDIIASAIREYATSLKGYMIHTQCAHWSHIILPNQYPNDECTCGLDAKLKEINE